MRTSDFGSEVRIWLKCLLGKVLRKCHLATMTYDTILYGGYSEPCQTSTKGASFQKELTVYDQQLLWQKTPSDFRCLRGFWKLFCYNKPGNTIYTNFTLVASTNSLPILFSFQSFGLFTAIHCQVINSTLFIIDDLPIGWSKESETYSLKKIKLVFQYDIVTFYHEVLWTFITGKVNII